jgi:hypothetical protein
VGCPGTSLRAREVSWMRSMSNGMYVDTSAYSDEELSKNEGATAIGNRMGR